MLIGEGRAQKSLATIVFEKYDEDGDGSLSKEDFVYLCSDKGYGLSDEEIEQALAVLDVDNNGRLSKAEFDRWWKSKSREDALHLPPSELTKRKQAVEAFNHFDTNKNGFVAQSEFEAFYNYLRQYNMTALPKEEFLTQLDVNQDGKVQFYEYIEFLERLGSLEPKAKLLRKEASVRPK